MKAAVASMKLSPAQRAVVIRYLQVFGFAFAAQLIAGKTGYASIPTLWAGITSAFAAGIVAVLKSLGQINQLEKVGFTLKEKTAVYQFLTGFAVMFIGALGANLATGAAHATTFPDLVAVVVAAISGAIFAATQWIISLIPPPKASA